MSRRNSRGPPLPVTEIDGDTFDISAFQSGSFSLPDLVSQLSDHLVEQGRQTAGDFNSRPFIDCFEAAVERLLPLRAQVFDGAAEHENDVAFAEKEYAAKLRETRGQFETVVKSFAGLETRIAEIGRAAVSIGDQLESIDRVRQRASTAHDILLYYLDFSKGDTSRLDALRKEGGRDGRAKTATLLRKLSTVAQDTRDIEGGDETCDAIEKYCEKFEKDMLKLFDRFYRKGDPKMMSHCAEVLQDFNGGGSCIQVYVNQHDFFISSSRLRDAAGLTQGALQCRIDLLRSGQILADPTAPAPIAEPGLQKLIRDITETFNQEAQIVQAVFPKPAEVMQVFLQRVFAQVVQSYIESAIEGASAQSNLAFLRFIRLAHHSVHQLVDDLKAHAFFKNKSIGKISDGSFSTINLQSATQASTLGTAAIAQMLDTTAEELFSSHLEGSRYIDREISSLTELYATRLLAFVSYHQAQGKGRAPVGMFDRMVNQLTSAAQTSLGPASAGVTGSPQLGQSDGNKRLKALMTKLSTTSRNSDGETGDLAIPASEGLLEVAVSSQLLEWHAEAVGRMVELLPPADIPKAAFALLRILADTIGRAYVETALETASLQTNVPDAKSVPDTTVLQVVAKADTIVQLWQRYVATTLTPLTTSSVTVRREMSVYNNHVIVRVEGKINEVLQHFVDAVLGWLANLLSRQKKLDFKPKSDEQALDRANTEACLMTCDFLNRIRDASTSTLQSRASEALLTEIGVAFHSQLLEHFKRFPVSATGGLMLTKDLAMYQDTMSSFSVPSVTERFDLLRQIGNVFLIGPETIKSYLSESHLTRIEPRLLRPYLSQRADYSQYSNRFWSSICGEAETHAPPVAARAPGHHRNISLAA